MFRSHNLGELNLSEINKDVILCGWVHKTRDLGGMTFVDLRDRYGVTQRTFNIELNEELCLNARKLVREYVIQISGKVIERSSKNLNISISSAFSFLLKRLKVVNPRITTNNPKIPTNISNIINCLTYF